MEIKVDRRAIVEVAKANDLTPHMVEKSVRLFDVLNQLMYLLDGKIIIDGGTALNYGRAGDTKPRLTRDLDLIYDGDVVEDLKYIVDKVSTLKGYSLDGPHRGDWGYNFYLGYINLEGKPDTIWFELYHSRPPIVKVEHVIARHPLLDLGELECRAVSFADIFAIKLDALSKHTRWQDIYDLNNVLPKVYTIDAVRALNNYKIDNTMWANIWTNLARMKWMIDEGREFMQTWVPKPNRLSPLVLAIRVENRLKALRMQTGLFRMVYDAYQSMWRWRK